MKHLLVALFSSLVILSACKQTTTTSDLKVGIDSTISPDDLKVGIDSTISPADITRTDSFVFASRTYALPRPCAGKNQTNCCTYRNNPDRVHCDSAVLTWHYTFSKEEAARMAEMMASSSEKGLKKYNFKKEPITCYLVNKQVSGYAMSLDSEELAMAYSIIVSGEVDGQAVVVQLETEKKPQNRSELPLVFRQILQLKP